MADGAQCVRILGLARFQTASHHLPDALLELPQQPLRYGVLRQGEAPQSDALDVVVKLQRAHTAMVQEAQAQPRLQRPLAPLAVMVACHQALIGQREQATGELQRFAEVNLQRGEHVFIGDKPFVQIGVRKTGRGAQIGRTVVMLHLDWNRREMRRPGNAGQQANFHPNTRSAGNGMLAILFSGHCHRGAVLLFSQLFAPSL